MTTKTSDIHILISFLCIVVMAGANTCMHIEVRDLARALPAELEQLPPEPQEDLWALLHPCGVSLYEYGSRPKPDATNCAAFADEMLEVQRQRKAKSAYDRLHDITRLADCISDPVDTASALNGYWTSWVLDGACLSLATDIRSLATPIQSSGLCSTFREDDYQSAVECQSQLHDHLQSVCITDMKTEDARDCAHAREIMDQVWNEGVRRDRAEAPHD
jgi:hypothetical protein